MLVDIYYVAVTLNCVWFGSINSCQLAPNLILWASNFKTFIRWDLLIGSVTIIWNLVKLLGMELLLESIASQFDYITLVLTLFFGLIVVHYLSQLLKFLFSALLSAHISSWGPLLCLCSTLRLFTLSQIRWIPALMAFTLSCQTLFNVIVTRLNIMWIKIIECSRVNLMLFIWII